MISDGVDSFLEVFPPDMTEFVKRMGTFKKPVVILTSNSWSAFSLKA